jgi:multidrug resistance protein, MATE family
MTSPSSLRAEATALIKLALPLCAVQLGYHLTGFVDTALAGRYSQVLLGACGVGTQIYFTISVVGIGLVMGVDPLVAQAFGAQAKERAFSVMWQGIYTALVASIPLMLLAALSVQGLEFVGVAPEVAHDARIFILARMFGIFPMLLGVVLRSYLQAAHWVWPIIISAVFANIINFVIDWVLLFGDAGLVQVGLPALGLPSFGAVGLGIASTTAAIVQTLVMAWAVYKVAETRGVPRPQPVLIKQIAAVGIPISLHILAEVAVFAWVGLLAGRATRSMAAHQIALSFASLTFAICMGLGAASSVQVGRAIGAGDSRQARRYGFLGISFGALFMTLSATVFWLAPQALVRIVTDDPNLLEYASGLLAIAACFKSLTECRESPRGCCVGRA